MGGFLCLKGGENMSAENKRVFRVIGSDHGTTMRLARPRFSEDQRLVEVPSDMSSKMRTMREEEIFKLKPQATSIKGGS